MLPRPEEFIREIQDELVEAFERHGYARIYRMGARYWQDRDPISMPTYKRVMFFDPTAEDPKFQIDTLYALYDFARWCNGKGGDDG